MYKEVGNMVQEYENLKNAYMARLRMSPFGMRVAREDRYLEDNSLNKNSDGSIRYPRPKQVDKLMNWLMVITGCVPAPAEFVPNPLESDHVRKLNDVYVRRPQYRCWKPQGKSFTDRVNEAQYRAYLFENYSVMDEGYLTNHDNPSWEQESGGSARKNSEGQTDGLIENIRRWFGKRKENT
jgi:hypothetical protein